MQGHSQTACCSASGCVLAARKWRCTELLCCGSLDLADLEIVLRERLLVDPSAVDTFLCGLQAFLDDATKVTLSRGAECGVW